MQSKKRTQGGGGSSSFTITASPAKGTVYMELEIPGFFPFCVSSSSGFTAFASLAGGGCGEAVHAFGSWVTELVLSAHVGPDRNRSTNRGVASYCCSFGQTCTSFLLHEKPKISYFQLVSPS
ncbi:hypothetical protein NL676_034735 [Syzygium grande]|nr:hypothetical protein NL676_034735 [Syzygium grande]